MANVQLFLSRRRRDARDVQPELPFGAALQVHVNERDEWIDLASAKSFAAETGGELFIYSGATIVA